MPKRNPYKLDNSRKKLILTTIAETGSKAQGYRTAEISSTAFYDAQKNDPNFKQAVEIALLKYYEKRKQEESEIRNEAEEYIRRVLRGEEFKVTYKEVLDVKQKVRVLKTQEQVVPNTQMLERVLGKLPEASQDYSITIDLAVPPKFEENNEE